MQRPGDPASPTHRDRGWLHLGRLCTTGLRQTELLSSASSCFSKKEQGSGGASGVSGAPVLTRNPVQGGPGRPHREGPVRSLSRVPGRRVTTW